MLADRRKPVNSFLFRMVSSSHQSNTCSHQCNQSVFLQNKPWNWRSASNSPKNWRWIIASENHVFTCFIDGLAFWAYIICKVFCHLLFLTGLIYCVIGYSCVKGSLVFDLIFSVKCNRVPLHLWTDKYHTSHIHT